MPSSKLDIVNVSLANLGVETLYSFEEQNSRARLCSKLYDSAWMYVQSDGNWTFNTKLTQVSEYVAEDIFVPEGFSAYKLPSDCLKPIDLFPMHQKVNWERVGEFLYVEGIPEYITLKYTFYENNSFVYPPYFCQALSEYLAMLLCRPLTGAKATERRELKLQYMDVRDTALSIDANANANNRPDVYSPSNDSFSN